MSNHVSKPGLSLADRLWLFALLILVFLTRLPFLDMGFGRPDAWRVGVTGKLLVDFGEYVPSRPPGFPLTELASTLSYAVFRSSPATWIATNTLTCLLFIIGVAGIWSLARRWNIRHPLFVAAIYAFAPLNWVYSVETIDYLWMTSLVILSVLAMENSGRWSALASGLLLGLATASRFSAGLLVIPMLILMKQRGSSWRDLLTFFVSFVLVSLFFYGAILVKVGDPARYLAWFSYLNRVSTGMAELKGDTFITRFLAPAVRFLGPLATIGVVVVGFTGLPKLVRILRDGDRGAWVCALIALFITLPYLWHMHPNYWIPATGFILILLAATVRPAGFAVVGLLIFAANFPVWQDKVEGLGFIPNPGRTTAIRAEITRYQNESVFLETKVRMYLADRVGDLMNLNLPSNIVIMAGINLPYIQFLTSDLESVDLPLPGGGSQKAWASKSGGPKYVYLIAPGPVKGLEESGYLVRYLPGMENMYYAENRVRIEDVPGVESLFSSESGK